jgi:serine/threonine protein phosphatase PrpC
MSSREPSLSRAAKRKQDKIDARSRDYESEKLLDGIYCILTALNYTNPPSPIAEDIVSPNIGNGMNLLDVMTTPRGSDPIKISRLMTYSSSVPSEENVLNNSYAPSPMSLSATPIAESSAPNFEPLKSSIELTPVQYVINHAGAVFGSKTTKSQRYRSVDVLDNSISPTHFKIFFKDRRFFVYDNESKSGTFVRRHVYNYPAESSFQLQKGRVLLTGKYQIEVMECIDSKYPKYGSVQDGLLVLKMSLIGSSECQIVNLKAVEVSSKEQTSLFCPDDGDLSAPDLSDEAKSGDENEEDEDMETEDGNVPVAQSKPSFESDDNSTLIGKSYSSSIDSDSESTIYKEICNHVRFVNGRFHLKNNPGLGLKFFSRVKKFTSRGKPSHHLSSGDIIRAGRIEFRVDIRAAPRPITDKKKEDIVSARDIGAYEMGNWLCREHMEDRHVAIDGFGKYPSDAFLGIYDGHAGRLVADFISCIFHVNLLHAINVSGRRTVDSMVCAMREAFETSSKMVAGLGEEALYAGSTAVCGLLWKDEKLDNERHVTVGNIGDCRAYICRENDALELTECHLASREEEAARVQAAGSTIVDNRIRGLTVTRAFGDLSLAKNGIISTPNV